MTWQHTNKIWKHRWDVFKYPCTSHCKRVKADVTIDTYTLTCSKVHLPHTHTGTHLYKDTKKKTLKELHPSLHPYHTSHSPKQVTPDTIFTLAHPVGFCFFLTERESARERRKKTFSAYVCGPVLLFTCRFVEGFFFRLGGGDKRLDTVGHWRTRIVEGKSSDTHHCEKVDDSKENLEARLAGPCHGCHRHKLRRQTVFVTKLYVEFVESAGKVPKKYD